MVPHDTSNLNENLTSDQAAYILDISSPLTVRNWLEGGNFPGSYRSEDGVFRFPRESVEEVKNQIERLRRENNEGHIPAPSDEDLT